MADQDDNSTSLLSTSEENTGEPNYDAIFGQDGPNLGKFAQPTIIGNVSLIIIIIYIYICIYTIQSESPVMDGQ